MMLVKSRYKTKITEFQRPAACPAGDGCQMSDIAASRATIRDQAGEAYLSGLVEDGNPYPIGSGAHREWELAYMLAAFEEQCG